MPSAHLSKKRPNLLGDAIIKTTRHSATAKAIHIAVFFFAMMVGLYQFPFANSASIRALACFFLSPGAICTFSLFNQASPVFDDAFDFRFSPWSEFRFHSCSPVRGCPCRAGHDRRIVFAGPSAKASKMRVTCQACSRVPLTGGRCSRIERANSFTSL